MTADCCQPIVFGTATRFGLSPKPTAPPRPFSYLRNIKRWCFSGESRKGRNFLPFFCWLNCSHNVTPQREPHPEFRSNQSDADGKCPRALSGIARISLVSVVLSCLTGPCRLGY